MSHLMVLVMAFLVMAFLFGIVAQVRHAPSTGKGDRQMERHAGHWRKFYSPHHEYWVWID